ncbi:putative signal transduction histidine kinase with CheB and CheR activity [Megalodesulfovibrio gigas DSM 1382 = ATCC 19364]|uniref:histidine kinase n=1 Tax=Megalodesulfovibrio gigas (strain ATCC 19364 / DSM 1382 / NCIMB 9332 / VKM B-1759) TaxID=1121448 RepID=T2GDJ0_MEGG1|nr:putative signal transduction histidine kinase with CheB and CheR activity [Megalodesulfovibrio gigas DSM 1382 = ATCC 19364]
MLIVSNISEQKQAQQALERANQRLNEAQTLGRLGDWDWDPATDTVTWSDNLFCILGLDPEGPPPGYQGQLQLYHPKSAERLHLAVSQALEHGTPYELELVRTKPDGQEIHVLARGMAEEEGERGVRRLYGSVLDITERKKAEIDLRNALNRLSFHVSNSPLAVIEWQEGKYITSWSKQAEAIFGWTADEVMGKNWGDFPIVHPEDQDIVQRQVSRLFACAESSNICKNRNLRKDGSVLHCMWYNSILREEYNGAVSILSLVSDVSELTETIERLLITKAVAEAATKAKSEFLANMSHEIRTPLNGIMGMLQLLQTTTIDAEQAEYVTTAVQSSRRLTRLLSDILDLSRVEAGKMDIVMQSFDFNDAMEAVIHLFVPTAVQKQLRLSMHINPAIPSRLVGDAARLQQVLSNLIGNALKFTNAGSVLVEAHPLPARNAEEYRVFFTVTDTGIGIPDDKLGLLFKPFTQVGQGYQREFQGAGLGLSICRRLVELMGGNISIESEPNEGTSFNFCITFGVAAQVGYELAMKTTLEDERRLSILVAEDDPVNRVFTVRMAEKLGHRVVAVVNGQEVLEALGTDEFDLILMDIQMPAMDGVEATQRIRAGEAGKDKACIPIVALTAYSMAGDRERFLAAGMSGYLAKPVELEALQESIRHAKGINNRTTNASGCLSSGV